MKLISAIAALAAPGIFFASCMKNITVTPPPYTGKPSIQCFIEADSMPILYLNQTVPYFDAAVHKNQLVIRGALITISSASATDTLSMDSTFDKLDCQYNYFYRGHKSIQSATSYNLFIHSGSDSYTASAVTDMLPAQIDSVSYIASFSDLNGEHEGVIVYFSDPAAQTNYYRYEMLRYIDTSTQQAEHPIVSACLGHDSILIHELGRSVFNDVGLQGQKIKIVVEPAYTHIPGKPGYIYIQSIDKSAYEFLDQLDRQKIAVNNPFVEPVFIKPGQFGDKAVGFFSAKKNSVPVLFVYPQ